MRQYTPPWSAVTIEHCGKTYRGSYYSERGKVTVWYGPHRKTARLGEASAEALAKILLLEIIVAALEAR